MVVITEDAEMIKRQPMSEIVADKIMTWIIAGTLKAGEKLSSESIAKQLGVSRMPVREALKHLEKIGLVVSRPYVGTYINTLQLADILEIYALRENLETFIVKYIMQNISKTDIAELKEMQLQIDLAAQRIPSDTMQLYKMNESFHMRLYQCSNMPRLCGIIRELWSNLAFVRLFFVNSETYGEKIRTEHAQYITALEQGDEKTFEKLILLNLSQHRDEMPKIVEQYNFLCERTSK